ncbi:hypothetical protein Hanom_Chr04g00337931 [Helianthus anomalus]
MNKNSKLQFVHESLTQSSCELNNHRVNVFLVLILPLHSSQDLLLIVATSAN